VNTQNLLPSLPEILAILPEISLVLLIGAVLTYDRIIKPAERRRVGLLAGWGSMGILLLTVGLWVFLGEPDPARELGESLLWGGMIRADLVGLVFRVMFLVTVTLVSLISLDVPRLQRGEYYALLLSATLGFSLMSVGADMIMLFLAIETASISLYVLAGFLTDSRRSTEAGIKYFVYGAFASAVMLYGLSLVYGVTGQTNIYVISSLVTQAGAIPAEVNGLFLLATVMIVAGFGFKVSAVPFHFWTPDVYEGAPSPVTAFVSTASKAAGFAVFIRVFAAGALGQPNFNREWWAMLVAITIVTMSLGNVLAIFQTNLKRMLAYSSIAQAGYTMIGLVALTPDGSGASMFYLLMYVVTNIVAFGVVVLVSSQTGSDDMEDFYGLSRRAPYLAFAMLISLLSLGGIPPTAGFLGKFFVFRAAVEADLWWLALIGVLNAFVALYYYLTVVKYMYLYRSGDEAERIPVSRAARTALVFSVLGIIYLGVAAGPAFEWTRQAGAAFFPFGG
jgi:NADH-quinone oxidoreductase subunit N